MMFMIISLFIITLFVRLHVRVGILFTFEKRCMTASVTKRGVGPIKLA